MLEQKGKKRNKARVNDKKNVGQNHTNAIKYQANNTLVTKTTNKCLLISRKSRKNQTKIIYDV